MAAGAFAGIAVRRSLAHGTVLRMWRQPLRQSAIVARDQSKAIADMYHTGTHRHVPD